MSGNGRFHKFELNCVRHGRLPKFKSLVHCLAEFHFLSPGKHTSFFWGIWNVLTSKRQLVILFNIKHVILKTNIAQKGL